MTITKDAFGVTALTLGILATAACGSSDGGGSSSGGGSGGGGSGGAGPADAAATCASDDDCQRWGCDCAQGVGFGKVGGCEEGTCVDGEAVCEKMCASFGGLVSYGPEGSVADSPECQAFCDKVASLGCEKVTCYPNSACWWHHDECPEGKIAELKCIVEKGKFECSGSNMSIDTYMCVGLASQCD